MSEKLSRFAQFEADAEQKLQDNQEQSRRQEAFLARAEKANDTAELELYGSNGRTFVDHETGKVIADKASPITGKLDEIRTNRRYGKTEDERIGEADLYEQSILNYVEEDGLPLAQAKLIVDLDMADTQKRGDMVGKYISQGVDYEEARDKVDTLLSRLSDKRRQMILEGGALTESDYEQLRKGVDLYEDNKTPEVTDTDDNDEPKVEEAPVDGGKEPESDETAEAPTTETSPGKDEDDEVVPEAESTEENDTLPTGHVEYDGKQWEVIEINADSKTGDRSFHLVYRNEKGHVTHKTVGESELNLPESTGDEDDAILDDTSWAGEAKNTEYSDEQLSEDPIDLSETAWVDEAVAKRDEAITVDTRGRARRYLDSRKERANGKEKGRLRRLGAAVAALALAATAVIGIGNSVKNDSNETATSLSSEDASADEAWDSDDNKITPTEEAASTDKVLPLPDSYYEKQEADAPPAGEISFTVGADIGSDGDAEVVVDGDNSSTAESTSEAIGNFSDKARTIERGEGGFQTLKELGVAESEWEETWQEVGEKLIEAGHGDMVYQMDDGRWGWAQSGILSDGALKVIAQVVGNH